MRKRNQSVMEAFSPTIRRRIPSRMSKNNLFLSFPGFQMGQSQGEDESRLQKSEDRVQKNMESLQLNHSKIHEIIDEVDFFIQKRMQVHEVQLISVIRKEIDKMHEETSKVVHRYNIMINQKNKQTQIYNLSNELDYFRSQALQLFETNKKLRGQMSQLRKNNLSQKQQIKELQVSLTRLTKKYKKEQYSIKQLKQQFLLNSMNEESNFKSSKNQNRIKMQEDVSIRGMIRKNNISEQKTRVKTDVEKTENDNRKLYTQTSMFKEGNMHSSFSNHKLKDKNKKLYHKSFVKYYPK